MGLLCSKSKVDRSGRAPRHPFNSFRRRSSSRELPGPAAQRTLLDVALDALCETLHSQPPKALQRLPPDLTQLVIDRLVDTQRLDDKAVARLAGLHFHDLHLAENDALDAPWMRALCSPSLEAADLSRTEVRDGTGMPGARLGGQAAAAPAALRPGAASAQSAPHPILHP